jgi:hypothetical protein
VQTLETWLAWIAREKPDDTEQAQHFWSHVAPAAADALLSRDDLVGKWEMNTTLETGRGLPARVVEALIVPFVKKAIDQLACFERWELDDVLSNLATLLNPHAALYRTAGQGETEAALAACDRAEETLRRLEGGGRRRASSGGDDEAWRDAIRVGDRLELEQRSAWLPVTVVTLSPTQTEVEVRTESGTAQWLSCDAAELRNPRAAAVTAVGHTSAGAASEEEEDEGGGAGGAAAALARAAVERANAWRAELTTGMWIDARETTTQRWSQAVILMDREIGPGAQSATSGAWVLTAEAAAGAAAGAAVPPRVREVFVHLVGWHASKRAWHDVSSRCIAPLNSRSKGGAVADEAHRPFFGGVALTRATWAVSDASFRSAALLRAMTAPALLRSLESDGAAWGSEAFASDGGGAAAAESARAKQLLSAAREMPLGTSSLFVRVAATWFDGDGPGILRAAVLDANLEAEDRQPVSSIGGALRLFALLAPHTHATSLRRAAPALLDDAAAMIVAMPDAELRVLDSDVLEVRLHFFCLLLHFFCLLTYSSFRCLNSAPWTTSKCSRRTRARPSLRRLRASTTS